jgi:hypothetical protein
MSNFEFRSDAPSGISRKVTPDSKFSYAAFTSEVTQQKNVMMPYLALQVNRFVFVFWHVTHSCGQRSV